MSILFGEVLSEFEIGCIILYSMLVAEESKIQNPRLQTSYKCTGSIIKHIFMFCV